MMIALMVMAGVSLSLSAATLGFVIYLLQKIDRLLSRPEHQHNRIAGESLRDRRARFLAATRETSIRGEVT